MKTRIFPFPFRCAATAAEHRSGETIGNRMRCGFNKSVVESPLNWPLLARTMGPIAQITVQFALMRCRGAAETSKPS
jgi:hypothetical protein